MKKSILPPWDSAVLRWLQQALGKRPRYAGEGNCARGSKATGQGPPKRLMLEVGGAARETGRPTGMTAETSSYPQTGQDCSGPGRIA